MILDSLRDDNIDRGKEEAMQATRNDAVAYLRIE